MTVPYERSLAMKSAGDFLRKMRNSAGLPAELREEAAAILRHYPNSHQIDLLTAFAEQATAMPHQAVVKDEAALKTTN